MMVMVRTWATTVSFLQLLSKQKWLRQFTERSVDQPTLSTERPSVTQSTLVTKEHESFFEKKILTEILIVLVYAE